MLAVVVVCLFAYCDIYELALMQNAPAVQELPYISSGTYQK
jgi:hypothetical protein